MEWNFKIFPLVFLNRQKMQRERQNERDWNYMCIVASVQPGEVQSLEFNLVFHMGDKDLITWAVTFQDAHQQEVGVRSRTETQIQEH